MPEYLAVSKMYKKYSIIASIRIPRKEFEVYYENLTYCLDNLTQLEIIPNVEKEVVIVDYGSIEPYKTQLSTIVLNLGFNYVREEAKFWSRARSLNVGIFSSTGERVFFIDADTLLPKNYVKRHLEVATDKNYITNLVYDSQEKIDKCSDHSVMISKSGAVRPCGWSHFSVDRYWLKKLKGYNTDFIGWGGEDDDILFRLKKSGVSRVTFKDVTPVHLYHKGYKDLMKEVGQEKFYKDNLYKNRIRYWEQVNPAKAEKMRKK